MIIALILAGAIGYMMVEKWQLLDAVFMSITTLTTIGYGEVHPLSTAGRIYTIVFVLFGVGLALYILTDMAETLIEANPTAFFGRRRMKSKISRLTGHQIVCGYGRTGQEVTQQFVSSKVPFVIVELDTARAKKAEEEGHLVLQADATVDEALLEAGIERAAGVVCALADDAANTFITLSARGLNDSINIVCRAGNPGSEGKMLRAGARKVISPYVICGRRMATAVTQPLVLEFLDVAMHTPAYDLRLEQITIQPSSKLIGQTLKDANIKQTAGAMVLAVNQQGKLVTNPAPDLVFKSGDEVIALGQEEQLQRLGTLAGA
jgi:voltage-gated potassium channel